MPTRQQVVFSQRMYETINKIRVLRMEKPLEGGTLAELPKLKKCVVTEVVFPPAKRPVRKDRRLQILEVCYLKKKLVWGKWDISLQSK